MAHADQVEGQERPERRPPDHPAAANDCRKARSMQQAAERADHRGQPDGAPETRRAVPQRWGPSSAPSAISTRRRRKIAGIIL